MFRVRSYLRAGGEQQLCGVISTLLQRLRQVTRAVHLAALEIIIDQPADRCADE